MGKELREALLGMRYIGVGAAMFIASTTAFGMPMLVDGNLFTDWGVSVADNNLSNYTGLGAIKHHVEDTNDNAGSGTVGPGGGGQNFDAELLASLIVGGKLYIAIVSGQRPDNGFANYEPGDIRITAGGDVYGIEVGGGIGGGAGGTINAGGPGSTYELDGSGYATGHTGLAGQVVGSIWKNPNWLTSNVFAPTRQIDYANHGSSAGSVERYVFTRDMVTNQHSIIELELNLSALGSPMSFTIDWGPSCGNDLVLLSDPIKLQQVPEPLTVALIGLGLVGIGAVRRRKGRRSADGSGDHAAVA